jgi:hypothetical protein
MLGLGAQELLLLDVVGVVGVVLVLALVILLRSGEPAPPRDDEYDRSRRVPLPGTVMAAGVIWIGYGCLGMLSALANFAPVGAANMAGGGAVGRDLCVPFCVGGVAIAFLACGYRTVTGKS